MMGQGNRQIEQQAAYWVECMHGPVQDSETAARFDQWIAADPRHVESFSRIAAVWESGALSRALATYSARNDNELQVPGSSAAPSAARDMACDAMRENGSGVGRSRGFGRRALAGLAALVALFLGFTVLGGRLIVESDYATRTGQERIVTLDDGSTIRLGGATRVHTRLTPWSREVTLARGVAFFDVTHEAMRSFEVTARNSRVVVLGTAFDVELLGEDAQQVRVYRGLVNVEKGGNSWRLPAGNGVVLSGTSLQRVAGVEGERPDWTDGWYDAQDTPLDAIVERINRLSAQPVVLAQPELGELRLSGRLRLSDRADLLDIICLTHDLHWYREKGRIVLARAP